MKPKDVQWPPLDVKDLKPDLPIGEDKVRFSTLRLALEKARIRTIK